MLLLPIMGDPVYIFCNALGPPCIMCEHITHFLCIIFDATNATVTISCDLFHSFASCFVFYVQVYKLKIMFFIASHSFLLIFIWKKKNNFGSLNAKYIKTLFSCNSLITTALRVLSAERKKPNC